MLIAAAVCPHPPLLIPAALGAAASAPPKPLRAVLEACERAVRGLLVAGPDLLVVVGGGPATCEYDSEAAGTLHGFGVPVTVGTGEPVLPLPLTVGRWLLTRAGLGMESAAAGPAGREQHGPEQTKDAGTVAAGAISGERAAGGQPGRGWPAGATAEEEPAAGGPGPGIRVVLQAVGQRASPADCRALGAALAQRSPRVALLAMGDASARRAREAPGAPDPQAVEYDDEVAEALAAADARWLAKLDPALDDQLAVAGRAAWQVLAGAAAGRRFHGRLLCMAAPYEVTYLVATWDEPQAG